MPQISCEALLLLLWVLLTTNSIVSHCHPAPFGGKVTSDNRQFKPTKSPNLELPEGEDAQAHYELLVQLGESHSGIDLRGIGKCLGNLYFFLNQPYVYFGGNDIFFNMQTKRFLLTNLDPARLGSYRNVSQLMQYVCNSGTSCNYLAENVYMAVYAIKDQCYFYVVNTSQDDTTFEHDFPAFWLDREGRRVQYHGTEHFSGLRGIPFSACTILKPLIRFLYYGKLQITDECDQPKYGHISENFPGSDKRQTCYNEKQHSLRLPKEDYFMLMADNSQQELDVRREMNSRLNRHAYRFGACIDSRYFIVTVDNVIVFKEYLMNEQRFNFFGFLYNTFSPGMEMVRIEYFFNIYVIQPNIVAPGSRETLSSSSRSPTSMATQSQSQSNKNVALETTPAVVTEPSEVSVMTAWVMEVYTDQPPAVTEAEFSGMPEKTMSVMVTYLVPLSKTRFALFGNISMFLLGMGTVMFCCLFCVGAVLIRRHRHGEHRSKTATIFVSLPRRRK